MRRLAAVFSKRDKSDSSQPSSDCSHPSSTQSFKKHLKLPLSISFQLSPALRTPSSIPSTPQLSSASEHGQSSASSSGSASLSPPTPDEDSQAILLSRTATKRSWKEWFGGKRSETADPENAKPNQWDRPIPVWDECSPTLQSPQTSSPVTREIDDTDEGSLSEFDDEGSVSLPEHPRAAITRKPSPAKARQNLELLIKNSLVPPLVPSPFVQHPAACFFPRSCNRLQSLPPACNTRKSMFNRRLLRRLEVVSTDDEREILPFSTRTPAAIKTPACPEHHAVRPPNTTRIFAASPGLRRWISRPCFEDRFAVFLPSKDGLHQGPVVGTLAVAALEYSEFVDVMVDPDFDPSLPSPDISKTTLTFDGLSVNNPALPVPSGDPPVSSPSVNPRHSYIPSPSPLRNQHNLEAPAGQPAAQLTVPTPSSPIVSSPTSLSPSQTNASSSPSPALPHPTPVSSPPQSPIGAPVKRVVRFVDDNEDSIPLHLLRQKKMREEKAKFLRTEQRRRLMEQEQERRRLEAESIEKERVRLAKEKERKEMEQRLYAEEVAASRLRRETQRAGVIPGLRGDSNNLLTTSPSTTSLREAERNRPHSSRRYSLTPQQTSSSSPIPRREASDSALPTHSYSYEFSGYRASNGGYSPAGSNSGHGHPSRPGSMHSTSSEDGRLSSRRYSGIAPASSGPTRPIPGRTPSHWSGSNQSLPNSQSIPPVPPLPDLMNDSVLLPPSAPFMMHQHPRQSRRSSPGPSNSSGSLRGNSANSSSERVNMQRHPSSQAMDTYSAPSSPVVSSSRTASIATHSRRGSGESRRSSMPVPPQSYAPRSQSSSLSRGRSQMPHPQMAPGLQNLQSSNPWTALPTQLGTLPTVMPVSGYSHSMGLNTLAKGSPSGASVRGKSGAKRQAIV